MRRQNLILLLMITRAWLSCKPMLINYHISATEINRMHGFCISLISCLFKKMVLERYHPRVHWYVVLLMHIVLSISTLYSGITWRTVGQSWNSNPEWHGWYIALHWRHNDHDGVSNHQPHDCLLNRLFRRRSRKTSKLRVTGLCVGTSPGPVISPHKGPVTRKMFPFDDVIMAWVQKELVLYAKTNKYKKKL